MEKTGGELARFVAHAGRHSYAKRLGSRLVAPAGQRPDAVDKLGVTGSSPVPPIRCCRTRSLRYVGLWACFRRPRPRGSSDSGYGSPRIAARSESQRCVRPDRVTVMVEAAVGVQLACMTWHSRPAGVTAVYAHM